jgi:hypothetical protein
LSEYFDHVERALSTAVRRRAHLPWYLRLRARNPRALAVVLAALVVAGPAVAAFTLLQSGSSVKPSAPPTPRAFNGVALKRSAQLLSLRVPDPASGPPWGLKLTRTTRGLLCVQVGRVAFGTLGALGEDGAFGDDGKFHPFSASYQPGPPCVTPDAHGNGFQNVAVYGVPANGLSSDGETGCRTSTVRLNGLAPQGQRRAEAPNRQPLCKNAELRDIYYGLLGPQAIGITYQTASGRLATEPTTGSDGAYLIVRRAQGSSAHPDVTFGRGSGLTYDAGLFPGVVRAVRYRDGHACQLPAPSAHGGGSCPAVGYTQPTTPLPTAADAASKISARVEPSRSYCGAPPPSEVVVPCADRTPPGFRRLDMSQGPAQVLVLISFVSKVPITNGHSYYYIQMTRAPHTDPRYAHGADAEQCGPANGDGGQTNSDYREGQLVEQYFFENLSCRGPVHGDVSLVITRGPTAPAPTGAEPGLSVGREVGRFNVNVP